MGFLFFELFQILMGGGVLIKVLICRALRRCFPFILFIRSVADDFAEILCFFVGKII